MAKQQTKDVKTLAFKALQYNEMEAIKGFSRISIKKPVLRTSEMLGIPYSTLRRWKSNERVSMKNWRVLLDDSNKLRKSLKLKLQTLNWNSNIKKQLITKNTAEHVFFIVLKSNSNKIT